MGRFLDRSEVWAAGDKRHVADIMLFLSPQKTPLFSMVKKGGCPNNSVIEWPFETEADPVTTAVADATDVVEADFENFEANNGMLAGRPQKTRVAIGVGQIANATTQQYGRGNTKLFAKNKVKALRKLKMNCEAIMLGLQDSAIAVNSNKTTYTTRGIGCWAGLTTITDTLTIAAAAQCPAGNRVNLATAAYNTLTEDQVRDVLQSIFDASNEECEDLLGLCVSSIKRRFADFTLSGSTASNTMPLRRFNQSQGDSTIRLRIDRYEGDFGSLNLKTHTTKFLPQSAVSLAKSVGMYVLDPDMIQVDVVVPIAFRDLEDRDGGPRGVCSTTIVNKVLNPLRIGVVHKTNA